MNEDANSIIRTYLAAQATLTAVVSTRIYCPLLPENATLPALGFFTRGGEATPYVPGLVQPSIQFDCWGDSPMAARRVYRALYEVLQGIQNISVTSPSSVIGTDGNDYDCILAHTAKSWNRPITGLSHATYWAATGGTGVGSAWINNEGYKVIHEIMSAIEEVQGQDLQDVNIPDYYRVLALFSIMIRAE